MKVEWDLIFGKYNDTITTFNVVEGKLEIDKDKKLVEINSTEGLFVFLL